MCPVDDSHVIANEHFFPCSVSGSVCVLRQLGWLRLLCSSRLQQPGLGHTAGHATDSGKGKIYKQYSAHFHSSTNRHTLICTVTPQNQAHRFLHRMGHSLVSGPQGNLWMYGGLSLSEGILGNVYR